VPIESTFSAEGAPSSKRYGTRTPWAYVHTLACFVAAPAKPDSNSPPALIGPEELPSSSSPNKESSLLRLPAPSWICMARRSASRSDRITCAGKSITWLALRKRIYPGEEEREGGEGSGRERCGKPKRVQKRICET
jgi:hypothetical protein